jgi:hypothetical protein
MMISVQDGMPILSSSGRKVIAGEAIAQGLDSGSGGVVCGARVAVDERAAIC